MPSLGILVVRSKLATREVAFEFAAESSDRMDRIADTARLVGGFAFTGTSRHFVQYRDAAAPFGYDSTTLVSTDAALALYHDRFSQTYEVERKIELRALLLRLMLRSSPSTRLEPGVRFLVAEAGLGPGPRALPGAVERGGRRLRRGVAAAERVRRDPVRRWVMRVPEIPARMRPLLHTTPGITSFVPAGPGVAVEAGFRHPIDLRACPLFDSRGPRLAARPRRRAMDHRPAATDGRADLSVAGRATSRRATGGRAARATRTRRARVPPTGRPCEAPWRNVTAAWIPLAQLPLLRRLAYALPHATVAQVRIALTATARSSGARAASKGSRSGRSSPRFIRASTFSQVTRSRPRWRPRSLSEAFRLPGSQVLFVAEGARAMAVEESAFVRSKPRSSKRRPGSPRSPPQSSRCSRSRWSISRPPRLASCRFAGSSLR